MVSLSNFVGNLNFGSLFTNLMLGAIFIVVIGVICVAGFVWFKNKSTYINPVTLIQRLDNGVLKKRHDLVGGMVKQKNGIQDFIIKIPKKFKKRTLGYVPDFSLADATGRLTFITAGDGMVLQQVKEDLITEKEMTIKVQNGKKIQEETISYSLIAEPIPTDVKAITINNIHGVENLMEANKFKAAAIAIGAFVLMVFVQIIFLFLTSGK